MNAEFYFIHIFSYIWATIDITDYIYAIHFSKKVNGRVNSTIGTVLILSRYMIVYFLIVSHGMCLLALVDKKNVISCLEEQI